jgi:uncharacterized surface protein with fasciclin (FAS1) repeats
MVQDKKINVIGLSILTAAVIALTALVPMSAQAQKPAAATAAKPGSSTITQIVVSSSNFDVLEAAVIKAGLAGALNGTDQYTVFAPTDAAFVSTLNMLTGGAVTNEAQAIAYVSSNDLSPVLLYHVTEGRRISTSVLAAPSYQMLSGGTLARTQLASAGIVQTDISARNGIVHVINNVLLP